MEQTNKKHRFLPAAAAVAGVSAIILQPAAYAQGDIAEVNTTVSAVGGVAAAAATIAIGAMGVRFAIKQVNRVAAKA